MKFSSIIFAAVTVAFAASCSNNNADNQASTRTDTSTAATATPVVATNEITDPVCGMVKDSTWTDYTIYKGDTVWFCAAPEKTAFEAHPEKYAGNLPKH